MDLAADELAAPSERVAQWAEDDSDEVDPFGCVLWPGAQLAASMLSRMALEGRTVLCVGAGTGLEALAAAKLGAARVIACDASDVSLALLARAADEARLGARLEAVQLDLFRVASLPGADVHVYADLLYDRPFALRVAQLVADALDAPDPPALVVTDSQQYAHGGAFLDELNRRRPDGAPALEWRRRTLVDFTGSSLLVDEDVTYSAEVRFLSLRGWAPARGEGG